MLTLEEIRLFIDMDAMSEKKRGARLGMRYYEGNHDIAQYRLFYVDAQGDLQEEKTKSNIKISHPFFMELVDQCTQYMLSGKDGFVRSDDPELQKHLNAYFNDNEDFTAELYDMLTGVQAKGFEYMYAYKAKDGKTRFQCADALGVVEVRARDATDNQDHVIYWYLDRVNPKNEVIRRIQVWDDTQTFFYCQRGEGDIVADLSQPINPRPHTLYQRGDKTYQEDFGRIPFFRLDNGKKQRSDLLPIKDLIDDYDLINCGLSNNIQDTSEALYVVKGFEGSNLDELMMNIKAKKHIGVDDGGDVDIKTVAIPVEARRLKMEIDENNIYKFGRGLNTANFKDSSATVSIGVKAIYSLLDLKANKLEIRLKQFMRKLLDVVLAEINREEKTDYRQRDVYFALRREVPTNESENAQMALVTAQRQQVQVNTLLNLASHLDNETLMQQVLEVLDLDYNELKDRLPKPYEDGGLWDEAALLDAIAEDEAE